MGDRNKKTKSFEKCRKNSAIKETVIKRWKGDI